MYVHGKTHSIFVGRADLDDICVLQHKNTGMNNIVRLYTASTQCSHRTHSVGDITEEHNICGAAMGIALNLTDNTKAKATTLGILIGTRYVGSSALA